MEKKKRITKFWWIFRGGTELGVEKLVHRSADIAVGRRQGPFQFLIRLVAEDGFQLLYFFFVHLLKDEIE